MSPTSPCPYPPEFLAAQRSRLAAARRRLLAQSPTGAGSAVPAPSRREGPAGPGSPAAPAVGPAGGRLAAADRATAAAGRPFALGPAELAMDLARSAPAALAAVEAAIRRLDEGRYGWDAAAGRWIPADRLQALPSADRCLSGQDGWS